MHAVRHIRVTAMLCKFVHATHAYGNILHVSQKMSLRFVKALVFNKILALTTSPEKFVSIWMRHTAVRDVKN